MPDDPENTEPSHDAPPHDKHAEEPLGPATPDDDAPAGDTPEVHDEIGPHDLPKDHPARADLVDEVGEDGTTRGNV